MADQADNATLMREAWAEWNDTKGADISLWDRYVSEDIKLCSLADGCEALPFTAQRSGREELRAYLKGLTENFAMDHWRIDETVSEGDRVVGIGSTGWTNRNTGKSFVTPIVIVTRWRDGRICEYAEFYDTACIAATTA